MSDGCSAAESSMEINYIHLAYGISANGGQMTLLFYLR